MSAQLILLSPAKLNLMLHIVGQRQDGYHELQTVFQLLDYGDTMIFNVNSQGVINLNTPFADVLPEDNLIYKAAKLLLPHRRQPLGIDIEIEKVLPMGGGLGGGSSNAATTLIALNHLWDCKLDQDSLASIGQSLGADVPVFVRGRSAWAEGIGEKLTPIDLPEQWFVILKPDVNISTAKIFSHRELTRNTTPITVAAFQQSGGKNDCENIVKHLYPEVDEALNWLQAQTKSCAMLTGTGACIFAPCHSKQQADEIFAKRPKKLSGFIAKGVNFSPICV